jgi:hypothetical protein
MNCALPASGGAAVHPREIRDWNFTRCGRNAKTAQDPQVALASRHGLSFTYCVRKRNLLPQLQIAHARKKRARSPRLYFPSGIRQSLRHLDTGRVPSRSGVVSRLHVAPAFLPAAPHPFAPTQCKVPDAKNRTI